MLFIFAIDKKMIKVAKFMIIPYVGKINWRLNIKNSEIIILIVFFRFFRFSDKAKPNGPFI